MMNKFAIAALAFLLPLTATAGKADRKAKAAKAAAAAEAAEAEQTGMTDEEYAAFVAASPFNAMYPRQVGPAAAEYFGEFNKMFVDGAIPSKEARLAAIAASAAIRCEYCITAQVHLAKKAGASDDEVKTAIQIAAEIARFSILLYGNEFGQDRLRTILKIDQPADAEAATEATE
ncbi:MAG: carboxymuconolactone decarboxylase family protein [Myxococcota bacterium]|nr:carboxymuconolactone decarboxylase family protein [Myxococcota bacterium]